MSVINEQMDLLHELDALEHARVEAILLGKTQKDPKTRWVGFCIEHKGQQKKCPQECFDRQAEQYFQRANEEWNGDGWTKAPGGEHDD